MGCGPSKKANAEVKDTTKKGKPPEVTLANPENQVGKENPPVGNTPEPMEAMNIVTETVEKKAKKPKEPKNTAKQKPNPLDLSEMPAYRNENPNFKFRDGDLSPILSPINASEEKVPSKKEFSKIEPAPKKIVVRRQKTTMFNWGNQGVVELKTISFKIKYSHIMKGFKMLKSKDNYQTTMLSWVKNDEEDVLEFTLKDTTMTNLRTGNSVGVSTPEIQFQVDPDGRFVRLCIILFNISD
jgi:hypothetical protein